MAVSVNPSPFSPCPQFVDETGAPAVGDKLFFYVAGSNTKQNTYTTSAGTTANANPVILDALGQPSTEIWFTAGQIYKVVWAPSTDTDPPSSPIRTWDNLRGMGDVSVSSVFDQWITYGSAATYISGTSFSVTGNQTDTFQIGRRIKTTNSGGTVVYSTITNSVFGAVTTVTLSNDSGALDSGLSAVAYGVISASNTSAPTTLARSGANTDITSLASPAIASATATTQSAADASTKVATTAYVDRVIGKIPTIAATVASSALTITLSPCVLSFRDASGGVTTSGAVNTRTVSASISVVVSSGSTLGTTNNVKSRLVVIAIDNAGTVELAVCNINYGTTLDETLLISTTAEGGAGGADSAQVVYSTTARSNVPFRIVGYVESTQATAGTWATAPSLIQGMGGNAAVAHGSIGYGQKWTSVTRTIATNYYNDTGRPIVLNVMAQLGTTFEHLYITVDGVNVDGTSTAAGAPGKASVQAIIPPGATYSWNVSLGVTSNVTAVELR